MTSTAADIKSAALAEAAEAACKGNKNALPKAHVRDVLDRYYRHVPVEDLPESAADMAGAVLSHRDLARSRPAKTECVRVHNPTLEEHGWHAGHTVVEIVTDDMAFLVDTVTAELSRQNRPIHQVVHPTVLVRRDADGEMMEIIPVDAAVRADGGRNPEWPDDAVVESWMHIEIDLETNADEMAEIEQDLRRVLRDNRAAVEDWKKMRSTAAEVAKDLADEVPEDLADEAADAERLLSWMAEHHFTFLGYREYDLVGAEGDERLQPVAGSGLGLLRDKSEQSASSFDKLAPSIRSQAKERTVLILTKANSRATVHRPVYLDYVGVKKFDAQGNVSGERRFLGLLTSAAYTQSVRQIPVIDHKVQQVLDRAQLAPGSHSEKNLQSLLETYPRDELLQMTADELFETAVSVMHLQERRKTKVYIRRDRYGRFASCLVFLPRDVYTTKVRMRMQAVLAKFFNAEEVDFTTRLTESVLARLHFVARAAKGESIDPDFDHEAIETELAEAARTWEEDLTDALRTEVGEEDAGRLVNGWQDFPEAYKESYEARLAVVDLRRFQKLIDAEATGEQVVVGPEAARQGEPVKDVVMNLYQPLGGGQGQRRFKVYRTKPLTLSSVLPLFRNLGVEVVDERPFELERKDGSTAYLYDFGLRYTGKQYDGARERFTEAFAAAWLGYSESDGLDRLVVRAGLTWRQVVLLRAYTKYLRQIGSSFSQNYVEKTLLDHAEITRQLVELFEARFMPAAHDTMDTREQAEEAITGQIHAALDDVESLDGDRILRLYLELIKATVRTNFYQVDEQGQPKPYVSCKMLPKMIEELPEPRPAYEIWVYSPRVEGVHLRYGDVARGGLRWSDRREDFRTEILGLVKAQMVKNAVIVPTGAKGGFYAKQLPDPSVDRDAWYAEGTEAYKMFISALLDVTDNLGARNAETGAREVLPPPHVVRHDGDDSYLVVAADKGTAAFSDVANGVSEKYGFWLGDAFASGGSVGYDHKVMGITARGAWESVKRHFREMGHDTQSEDFTVVGIGDMSGDVFGNGMLLSEHIRLVAAFNHMHIFIDPNPDAASSFAERQRMFDLGRSTWEQYDSTKISAGGGVFSRSAKSIALTPQIRAALGIDEGVEKMTPAELMKAILMAPVDLLWNGGIGTYVKAESESHAQVGDRANDVIRLDGNELNVKVVGEGGNLGLTQAGRIEAALSGVRLNTDAIDNSAGVDCSDHEVNIKILLDQAVNDGDLTTKQRNELLASMTDVVADLVLADNIEQNILLSNARWQSPKMLRVHHRFIKSLEAIGELDRELEGLPSDKEIARREEAGLGLTSPELSVLVAYAKIRLEHELLASDLPSEPWFRNVLNDYFPPQLVERFADRIPEHPLASQIIVTSVANEIVNRGGITFAYRALEETGVSTEAVARAFVVSRCVFGLHGFTSAVDNLPASVSTDVQAPMYLEFRRLLDRSTRRYLSGSHSQLDVAAEIERYEPLVSKYHTRMGDLLVGGELDRMSARTAESVGQGVPEDVARWEASLLDAFSLLDVRDLVEQHNVPEEYVSALYFVLSERYQIDQLLDCVSLLSRENRWLALARGALRDDLYVALESITSAVLEDADSESADPAITDRQAVRSTVDGWVKAWEDANADQIRRVMSTIREVQHLESADLATMSVVLRQIRALVKSASSTSV